MATIEVEIPGKGIAEFPEGTDEAAIVKAIRTSFPEFAPPSSTQNSYQPLDIGEQLRRAYSFTTDPAETFKPFPAAERAIERLIPSPEAETEAMHLTGIKHEPGVAETVALKAKSALQAMASPGGVALAAAGALAPEIVGPLMAAQGGQQVGQGVGEIARGETAAGVSDMALGGLMITPMVEKVGSLGKLGVQHETILPRASETFKADVKTEAQGASQLEGVLSASKEQSTTAPVRDVLRGDEGGAARPEQVPEGVNEGGAGIRGNQAVGFAQAEAEVTPPSQASEAISRQAPTPESEVNSNRGTGDSLAVNKAENAKVESAPTVANIQLDVPRIQSEPVTLPSPASERPLGIVAPSTLSFLTEHFDGLANVARQAKEELSWKSFAQQTLPKWTEAQREVGEAGAEYAAAPMVGELVGKKFARDVLGERASDAGFDRKLGVALKEDNLRDIRKAYQDRAEEARAKAEANPNARAAYEKDAELYDNAAQAVVTLVGGLRSPFRSEGEYRTFLDSEEAQGAIARYKQLWAEQKEPLFREAAGLDPETELAGRGLETGARINLTFERAADESAGESVKGKQMSGAKVRQLGTLLQRDPFLRQATGTGTSYHAALSDTMADAFRREYPVAKQHEFIRKALESGVAQVGKEFRPPEGYRSYPLKLNPWRGENLYIPERLAVEYEALVGLAPGLRIPAVTPLASLLTRQSIMGLGEGTAHSANILLKLFTGVTTSHPWMEALVSALPGRLDAWAAVARALVKGLRPDQDAMLELAKINAAKRGYSGAISSRFLNPLDNGVRLLAKEVFEGLARGGVVKDTPTNLREFVNEVGNYTQSVQSPLVRSLRSSQVQPFATGFRTSKVQAMKRLALAPGVEATSTANAVALRAAILGKFIGTALTVAAVNWIVSKSQTGVGNARGYQGTRLGAISWKDKDGKVQEFDLGGLLGATTGARAIGAMQFAEAKERNLATTTALAQGARGVGTTLTSQFAGPAVRTTTVGLSGKDPYGNQVADLSPQGSDPVKNLKAALQGVNPLVDVALGIHEGKAWNEVWQRQLTRYAAHTPSTLATSDKFTEVVTKKNLLEYADWLASRARKLSMEERAAFVRERLERDDVKGPQFKEVQQELRRKGVYRFR